MSRTVTIPADGCYWIRLPASPRRWTRQRILAGIEPWTPAQVDDLALAWAVGSDRQVVVVALEPDRLDACLATAPEAWAAVPDGIPEHVAVPGVAADALNLLTGPRTPPQQRRLDTALAAGVLAAGLCLAILVMVGAWRRAAAYAGQRSEAAAVGAQQLSAVLPTALAGNDPDPQLRLEQAQRLAAALVRAADGPAGGTAGLCNALLSAWPSGLRVQVANLAIDGGRCTISGAATSVAEAQKLAAALSTALASQPGWRMLPLQAAQSGAGATFTCTLVREGA